ncbi:MAG: hypothetical protein L3J21_04125 [Devosiaceae bacterium]|nr:hypothetical protein [Devosiaceae bacterium]
MANQDNQKEALTPEEFFKKRFVALMADLGKNASKDPQTIWLIGSLAGSILSDANIVQWSHFKSALSAEAYNRLLAALKTQGNDLAKDKNHRAAYAVETIAISIIAPTMAKDPHIASGNELLDKMIGDAVGFYHKNPAQKPN